jgi:metal transporter CNNM
LFCTAYDEKVWAEKIAPVRADGNLLLCTLLLCNVAVNSLLSILWGDLAGGTLGFLVSTATIVIFGEIIPQATCSRYALKIGASTAPLVKLIVLLFFPVAKPIAMCLDYFLGAELGTIHNEKELNSMIKIYVEQEALGNDQGEIMEGAINYTKKVASDVMTAYEDVFMVSREEKLDFKLMMAIFDRGHSRIPVYGRDRNDIVGLLHAKDMMFLDPADGIKVANFIRVFGRGITKVDVETKLSDCMKTFRAGHHIAIVYNTMDDCVAGILTLEDVVEEILQTEIIDEYDEFCQIEKKDGVVRSEVFDYARLALDDYSDQHVQEEEATAIAKYLQQNHKKQFQSNGANKQPLSLDKVVAMLMASCVINYESPAKDSTSVNMDGKDADADRITLYKHGRRDIFCTVILEGKVNVFVGKDNFKVEQGQMCVLAADALLTTEGDYVPDFTAEVNCEKLRCIRIHRAQFEAACGGPKRDNSIRIGKKFQKQGSLRAHNISIRSNGSSRDSPGTKLRKAASMPVSQTTEDNLKTHLLAGHSSAV